MRIANRRGFLKQIIGSTALVGLACQLSLSFKDAITSELRGALSVWRENETTPPYLYIDNAVADGVNLKQIIQEEFLNSIVLEVNGLVLSKLEVAILAAIALENGNT